MCDTGPLLHLSEAGAIHLLQQVGQVITPAVVATEFEQNTQGWHPPQWILVRDLDKTAQSRVSGWVKANQIDAGEAEAIALVLQTKADWLLTDDAQARQFAEKLGVEVHGSIGVLLWNLAAGHITGQEAKQLLEALEHSSLWISERVLREARSAIETLSL